MNHNLRNICLAAHVDAGKTSLAERILFQTGAVRTVGSVDDGSSFFDASPLEIQRGITIFSEISSVFWREHKLTLIDTPGHIDFVAELERALKVVEGVILIISAPDGIQQHTELIWELLKLYKIPTIFFINKADRPDADIQQVFTQILRQFTPGARLIDGRETACFSAYFSCTEWQTDLLEFLAERDQELFRKYVEDQPLGPEDLFAAFRNLFQSGKVFPVFAGSAKTGLGIARLLDAVVDLVPAPPEKRRQGKGEKIKTEETAAIRVFKVNNEDKAEKKAYVKVLAGTVNVRDPIFNSRGEACKVTRIRTFLGNKGLFPEQLAAGDIGILSGLKGVAAGEVLGGDAGGPETTIPRVLQTQVVAANETDWPKLHNALLTLNEEDPLLEYEWDQEAKEMYLNIMGSVHLEVLESVLANRFGLNARLTSPVVKYYETVAGVSRGFCHFEPKKHYAEVEIELKPNGRDQGNVFDSEVPTDDLPAPYQKAIEKSMTEALRQGVLTGNPVRDVKVRLIAGRYHLEHTHGGDFRIATIRAVQQALENNRIRLLEPVTAFKITAGKDAAGRIMADVAKMKGECAAPVINQEQVILTGQMPLATSLHYPLELAAFSGGKAQILLRPSGFQLCHNQEQILAALAADPDRQQASRDDILYNSVSLFRAKRKMKKVINESALPWQDG
jgi:ribosomal protection tetracycline resistance protein